MTRKTFIKSITSAVTVLALVICPLNVFASVLGSSKINGYTVQLGEGTTFTHNLFYSDQSGVGKQSENYFVYTPNSTVLPSLTYGKYLYGSERLSSETSKLESQGYDILGGTNADYFSLQTGVPMSNAIIDGKIVTKDATGQDAIGILEDGTAFISYVYFNSILVKEDGTEVNIYNINKYRQPYSIYMMTDEFSDTTRNSTKGIDVILGSVEGEMRLGTKLTAVVESVSENSSAIPIPEGKIVLTVDANAPAEFFDPIASLKVGEKITVHFSANGDKRWNDVKLGMGSVGGRLLIDGEVNPNLPTGASPRTAIGITDHGEIIIYTIDGRQSGHSYGVQLKTLARRMQELGCVEALNLDGGGSTAITAQLPGNNYSTIKNKPSDGRERNVSTYFFLVNTAEKTGNAAHLHLYPNINCVLTGAELQLSLLATDSGFHPVEVPENVEFSVQQGKKSTVTQDGLFTARDNGTVTVYAESGDAKGSVSVVCLESPTEIIVKNKNSGNKITALNLEPGEKLLLTADAFGGYNQLTETDENFIWDADPEIGSFDEAGNFTASDKYGATGDIRVSAGETVVTIPVVLISADSTDPNSYPIIDMKFEDGALTGTISCNYNIETETDGILLLTDGVPHDFVYDSETGEFTATINPDTRKISVYATNIFGYTTYHTMDMESTETEMPFADTAGHWAEDVLGFMYEQGIINGDPTDGTLKFNPQKQMTRSEFAVMTANYLHIDPEDYADVELPYTDLDTIPFWALDSFKALYALDILKGRYVTDTESCADPLASISRAEAATIVARTLPNGFFETEIIAPDAEDVAPWAENGISTLISIGAMKGYEDGTLQPAKPLTKAEAAKILYSVM